MKKNFFKVGLNNFWPTSPRLLSADFRFEIVETKGETDQAIYIEFCGITLCMTTDAQFTTGKKVQSSRGVERGMRELAG